MSFYGSVYYQLIDTFYKVVLRNRGADKKTFLSEQNVPEWLETQAVGRKGVFGFDSGNRWINLNTYSENKPDSNEQFSIYEIYHGAPDANASKADNGFKVLLTDAEVTARTKDGVIHLQDADEFETYENKYDDAGHIASSVKKVYRLPKAEVNDKVDKLEQLVGDSTGRTLPELENEKDKNLYGYTEENSKDITALESYVGNWKNSTTYWDWGGVYAPTIVDAIGNLDEMYGNGGYQKRAENPQTFVQIIGNLPDMWKEFNKDKPISLSEIVIEQKEDMDQFKNNTDAAIGILNAAVTNIGSRPDGYDTLYTEVVELHGRVDDANTAHAKDKTDMEKAYKDADAAVVTEITKTTDALGTRATNAENAINTINNTTIPAVNAAIQGVSDRVTEHQNAWSGTEKALTEKDAELAKDIDDLSKTVGTNNTTLDGKIDSTKTALEGSIKAVSDSIGTVTEGSTVVKMINDGDKANKDLIDSIRTDLGNTTDNNGLIGVVSGHTQSISDINTKMGTVGDKALSVQITENLSAINTLNTNALMKTEAENTYAKKSDLNDYAKSADLEGYLVADDLDEYTAAVSQVSEDMKDVAANLETLGVADYINSTPEGSTILAEIFSRLTKIENDITAIKTAMNELHTDNPPFPVEEEEETE